MRYLEQERTCEECGERFWSARARYCSKKCSYRRWRTERHSLFAKDILAICRDMILRADAGSDSWSKLLPRLLRATGAELRRRGMDPFSVLMSSPDEPVNEGEDAPGGIEGEPPKRTRWLHPPDEELKKLEAEIVKREASGHSAQWHRERRVTLLRYMIAQHERELASASLEAD